MDVAKTAVAENADHIAAADSFSPVLALALNFAELASAAPGMIATSLSSMGPVLVGETFTATFRISGYTDMTEIDGFSFKINFPGSIFAYIEGTQNTGDTSGPNQQWLTKPSQDLGFTLLAIITNDAPDTVTVTMLDVGTSDPQGGTVADGGFLVAFDFMATGLGMGKITPGPSVVGAGGPEVLFKPDSEPAGVPSFAEESITVVPEPGPVALFVSGGVALLAFQFRRHRLG